MKLKSPLLSFLVVVSFGMGANAQEISVRLFDLASPRQVSIGALDGEVRLFAGDFADPLMTLSSGEEAVVSRASDQLHVHLGDMRLFAKALRVEPMEGAEISLSVREGRELSEDRMYPGLLRVSPAAGDWELRIVNVVPLEEYVASVVSSEYGFDDLEGSKAMAVIARTYALATVNAAESETELFDHTLSQVYRGSGETIEVARDAARQTAGEVLTYEDALIEAVYFSSSGGHTADNETVWDGSPLPYLRGKPDPHGADSPHSRWTARIPRTDLLEILSAAYQTAIDGFVLGERSADGRVSNVELLRQDGRRLDISANEFRLLVISRFGARSLRSTLFDARRDGDTYVFEGKGYGHGVGLSQWGAHDLAVEGESYRDILEFYYTGVEIAGLDGSTRFSPPVRQVATRPEPDSRAGATQRIGW